MAKSKKEFSKEAMYKKIMPSMFRINDENRKSESNSDNIDEENEIGILDPKLSNLFVRTDNIYLMDDVEDTDTDNDNENDVVDSKEVNNSLDDIEEVNTIEETKKIQDTQKNSEILNTQEIQRNNESKEESLEVGIENLEYNYTVNFIEVLIKNKLYAVLERFKCCQCESCIADIVDIALNSLPKYSFTGSKKEIKEAFDEFEQTSNIDVISAIIKAIILIRNKEKHNKK